MKVFMPRPNEDWVCDQIISEFESLTRHQIVRDPRHADVIFLYAKWIHNHFPPGLLQSRKVITTVHHIVPEKTTAASFIPYEQFTDAYHVPNSYTEQDLHRVCTSQIPITKLPYWINDSRWHELKNGEWSPGWLNDEELPFLASFQRDTEGNSIGPGLEPKPKLEKGPDIFVDIVKRFKPNEFKIFIPGWRRDYINSLLQKTYDVICWGKQKSDSMNTMYNVVRKTGGYYLVTSRYEGGPQAVLEAAQTKTKILSTDVGLAKDILHPDCICSSIDEFEQKIRDNAIEHTINFNYENVQAYKMDVLVPKYDDFIDEVAG